MTEELPRVWLPGPPEVQCDFSQRFQDFGEFWDDVERVYRLHVFQSVIE